MNGWSATEREPVCSVGKGASERVSEHAARQTDWRQKQTYVRERFKVHQTPVSHSPSLTLSSRHPSVFHLSALYAHIVIERRLQLQAGQQFAPLDIEQEPSVQSLGFQLH